MERLEHTPKQLRLRGTTRCLLYARTHKTGGKSPVSPRVCHPSPPTRHSPSKTLLFSPRPRGLHELLCPSFDVSFPPLLPVPPSPFLPGPLPRPTPRLPTSAEGVGVGAGGRRALQPFRSGQQQVLKLRKVGEVSRRRFTYTRGVFRIGLGGGKRTPSSARAPDPMQ